MNGWQCVEWANGGCVAVRFFEEQPTLFESLAYNVGLALPYIALLVIALLAVWSLIKLYGDVIKTVKAIIATVGFWQSVLAFAVVNITLALVVLITLIVNL